MPSTPALEQVPGHATDSASRWEIPLAAGLSALFFLAFLVVPLAGSLGIPFAALPPVRVAHRRGTAAGLLAAGLASAVVLGLGLATGGSRGAVHVGLAAALTAGLPAFFAGRLRAGAPASGTFLALAASGALLFSGILLALPLSGERPVGQELSTAFDAMIPAAVESYRRSNMDPETVARVRTTLLAAKDFATRYWAGLLGASWVLASAVAFYGGARAARPAPSAEATRFEELRVAAPAAALFVSAGALFALLEDTIRTVAGDFLLALAALYFVAGLSIICHFARRWFRVPVLRGGLYALVAYFPMNVGVALLGLFDWYVNFRRRGEKAQERR